MRRIARFSLNVLFLIWTVSSVSIILPAETYTSKNRPDFYNAVPDMEALQKLTNDYKAGTITFDQFQAKLALLEHNAKATSDDTSAAIVKTAPPSARLTTSLTGIASKSMSRFNVSSSAAQSPCPEGWTPDPLSLKPDFICEQDCYNKYDKSVVQTTIYVHPDGSPILYGGNGEPVYGGMQQLISGDDGHCNSYTDEFVGSAADLATLVASTKQYGAVITFQGAAPDPKTGYQIQYYFPRDNRPAGSCTPQPYKQSATCPQ